MMILFLIFGFLVIGILSYFGMKGTGAL